MTPQEMDLYKELWKNTPQDIIEASWKIPVEHISSDCIDTSKRMEYRDNAIKDRVKELLHNNQNNKL